MKYTNGSHETSYCWVDGELTIMRNKLDSKSYYSKIVFLIVYVYLGWVGQEHNTTFSPDYDFNPFWTVTIVYMWKIKQILQLLST